MSEIVVTISKDGSLVEGLYFDEFPWHELGDLTIHRISDIRFDEDVAEWRIWMILESRYLPESFVLYRDAVEYERKYMNERMVSVQYRRKAPDSQG